MTDTPAPDETPEVTEADETLGEKIQHGAEELSENPVIKKSNDEIDDAEEFIGDKLHLHHHHAEADEASTGDAPTA